MSIGYGIYVLRGIGIIFNQPFNWLETLSAVQKKKMQNSELLQSKSDEIACGMEKVINEFLQRKHEEGIDSLISTVDKLLEIMPSKQVSERLEVLRSKYLIETSDSKEKVRSIQYIAWLGKPDDIPFLEQFQSEKERDVAVRDSAKKAIEIINKRSMD